MAATFAVPFFAYPDQLMADTQDDLDAVNKQLEELRNKQSELNASYGELNEKLSASGEKLSSIEDAVNAKQSEIDATNIQVADMQAEIDQQLYRKYDLTADEIDCQLTEKGGTARFAYLLDADSAELVSRNRLEVTVTHVN